MPGQFEAVTGKKYRDYRRKREIVGQPTSMPGFTVVPEIYSLQNSRAMLVSFAGVVS
jgi:hypothetical protein